MGEKPILYERQTQDSNPKQTYLEHPRHAMVRSIQALLRVYAQGDREGKDRADTRERIIRLHSGRWQYEDETACYDVTDFFEPYTYFEILYFYP